MNARDIKNLLDLVDDDYEVHLLVEGEPQAVSGFSVHKHEKQFHLVAGSNPGMTRARPSDNQVEAAPTN